MGLGAAFYLARHKAACLAAAAAFVLVLASGVGQALASGPIVPDSSCATESQFKSISGTQKAVLQIINNSDETVKAYWLDYTGKRVFYEDIKPHTSFLQATWLTHPWVITSASGACYRFLVMNSLEQSVTVEPVLGPGETMAPLATSQPTEIAPGPTASPAPAGGTGAPAGASAAVATTPAPGSAGSTPASQPGPGSTIAIAGLAAAVVALIAFLLITGRMPGIRKGPRS